MAAERGALALLRAEAEALVSASAPGAFLRWARGEGLFVTDAPRRGADPAAFARRAEEAGWLCAESGGLWTLTPSLARLQSLEAACGAAETPFARAFARFRGREMEKADAEALLTALKCRALRGDVAGAERRVRQRAAVALRGGRGGGGLYLAARVIEEAKWDRIP